MSDPVSNSEIEDVLASIRRLVSENAKALKGDRGRDPEAEKLVLTPALRIDESEAPPPPSDVFAVDTETWNDVSGKLEETESKGIFSHTEQRPPAVVDAIAGSAQAAGQADSDLRQVGEPEADTASGTDGSQAAEGGARAAAGDDATAVAATDTGARAAAGPESAPVAPQTDISAATALEQRIAELETAMDLHPANEETRPAAASDAVRHDAGRDEPAAFEAAGDTDIGAPGDAEDGEAATGADRVATAEEIATQDHAADEHAADEHAADQHADDSGDAAAPAASDAPPRSWIEGLVAAAAAAEAGRIAERAKAHGDTDKDHTLEAATAAGDDGGAEVDDADVGADAVTAAAAADIDESTGDAVDDAAEMGPLELNETHAVTPAAETVEPEAGQADAGEPAMADAAPENEPEVEAPVAEASEGLAEAGDLSEPEEISGDAEAAADEGAAIIAADAPETASDALRADEPSAEEDQAEENQAEEHQAEENEAEKAGSEVAAGPERSWVDRLIAAAATLRSGPSAAEAGETAGEERAGGDIAGDDLAEGDLAGDAPDDDEAAGDAVSGEPVESTAAEAEAEAEWPDGEDDAEAAQAGDPEARDGREATETAEADERLAPLALEPLNLVDPIAMGGEPEAAVPEWEPAETPDAVAGDAGEPVVDIDTVLTGPWTAAAVAQAGTDAPTEAEDAVTAAEESATEEAADAQAVEAAAEEAADAQAAEVAAGEVPVGALEWEPVEQSQQRDPDADTDADILPEPAEPEVIDQAADGAETDDADTDLGDGGEVEFSADIAAESVDYQQEPTSNNDEDDVGDRTSSVDEIGEIGEIGETDGIDEDAADAAAVAAAAEAEADWEDAGMAAAGVALSAAGPDPQAPADESATPEADAPADAEARGEAGLGDEAVIDEAMLRELVAQLVRDELQGTVGERITHNVRRLIRREIARALTLQDFEK